MPVESGSLEERQQADDDDGHVDEGGERPRLVEPVRPRLLSLRHEVDVPAVDGVVEVGARQDEHLLLLRRGHTRVVVTLQLASFRFH